MSGQARTPDQIGAIVVKTTPGGAPIHISDIATVHPSVKPIYTAVTANGKPALLLNVNRQPDGNTVEVARLVHDEIETIRKTLPKGIELNKFYDQSELVIRSIQSVRDAILIGLVLAVAIIVLFLRDWGSSLIAGLVIPATIAITFIVLRLLGESFNLMTLGGLAAAVGLVIDDAIVVVENIVLHRDAGQTRSDAIRMAIQEIRKPLIGSTVTPIVVFLPLMAISGVTGVFFRALAVTVGASLLASLALALTWTPALSALLLKSTPGVLHDEQSGFMGRILRLYERVMRVALGHGWILGLASVLLIAGSYFGYKALGSDLLPEMDEGGFILDYFTPAGASLEETNRIVNHVDQILRATPEVEVTSRRTGLQLGLAAVTEANRGDFTVKLKEDRKRNLDEVISDLREKLAKAEPTLEPDFIKLLQDMIGDLSNAPEPIHVKLFAQDPALLRIWGPKLGDAIKKAQPKGHGVVDIKNGIDNTISGPAVLFQTDPAITARAGFATDEVELAASALMQGEPATAPVIVNDRAYNLRVRFPERSRNSIDAINNTLLASASGSKATLGTLAKMEEIPGQVEIIRENQQRLVAVTGRLEGLSLGEGIDSVKQVIAKLRMPSSIRIAFGGAYEEQQRSFRDLALVLSLAIVLVFTVLLFEFGGFSAPIAILASALLSTAGVIAALLITKTTFNISSFMGLIMVIGIVAKNGILLLDADQKYRAEGKSPEEAMLLAGERRLRPIMMTALATVAGMIPLALALGAGSQMLQPLAIAVIGGILASMVLSLIVTPAVYYYLQGTKTVEPLGRKQNDDNS